MSDRVAFIIFFLWAVVMSLIMALIVICSYDKKVHELQRELPLGQHCELVAIPKEEK